jgi:copper homeostasis protein CutC
MNNTLPYPHHGLRQLQPLGADGVVVALQDVEVVVQAALLSFRMPVDLPLGIVLHNAFRVKKETRNMHFACFLCVS